MTEKPKKRASFRTVTSQPSIPKSPRDLFYDLNRDEAVKFLWDHQGKQLDDYFENYATESDVALELPTGTGKTLIGLLIAEWRREMYGERVAYLCPTRQLVRQVSAQAKQYGIDAPPVLAKKYPRLGDWERGDVVAVTTYSAVFNSAPRIDSAQSFVLDDAHAADGFISDAWTTRIRRSTNESTYMQMLTLLENAIEPAVFRTLVDEHAAGTEKKTTDIVPTPFWWPYSKAISDLLDARLDGTDDWFSWSSKTRHQLFACNLIVGWDEIQLTPHSPTTLDHAAFGSAGHRLYMSATLGASGDLERAFGVRNIGRIPIPVDWEKHSSGRRLFLFPEDSLSGAESTKLGLSLVERAGRALDLLPNEVDARRKTKRYEEEGLRVVTKDEIEDSLDAFTDEDNAVLVLANRYDGIDLPGEDCRLMFLDGLPVSTNLLERFLYQRLSLATVLRERMLTRFTQGVGRCTRSASDFSVVVVRGRSAIDFVSRNEVRGAMHPELQAEIEFGLSQSDRREIDDFEELFEVFLENGDEWREASKEIVRLREDKTQSIPQTSQVLLEIVESEVDFAYAMSNRDFPRAVEKAISVADRLGGPEFGGYRSWWHYCAGSAAWLASAEFDAKGMDSKARELFSTAASTGKGVSWFADLAYRDLTEGTEQTDFEREDLEAAERVHNWLLNARLHGRTFELLLSKATDRLAQREPKPYEAGLKQLGEMLGWNAIRPKTDSAPDSIWMCGQYRLTLEAKSDETPDGTIGSRTAQQCSAQPAWAAAKHGDQPPFYAVLVTPREKQSEASQIGAEETTVLSLSAIEEIAHQAATCLREMRALISNSEASDDRARILEQLAGHDLLPSSVFKTLRRRRLADMSVDGFDTSDDAHA